MAYKTLKTIFHMSDEQNFEKEYQQRLNNFTTYVTDIEINPIRKQIQIKSMMFPLFFCPTKTIIIKAEKILINSSEINKLINS